jgi:hypothetical protein
MALLNKILKILILLLIATVFSVIQSIFPCNIAHASDKISSSLPKKNNSSFIIAYYLHGDYRCSNCLKIEQYSRDAIEVAFKKELTSGKLRFQVLNTDKPENEHFIQDYQLYTKSLVIVRFENGKQAKWKNLEKVWQYLNNEEAFFKYVQEEIRKYIEEL